MSRITFSIVVLASTLAAMPPAQRVQPLSGPPVITAVSPAQGPIAGGFDVTVTGSGFTGATVRLDGAVMTPASQTDGQITIRMPAHANGYVVIAVRSGSTSAYGEFLYVPPRLQDLPPGYITTVAGMGSFVRDYGPAIQATVSPSGLSIAPDGTLYIAEAGANKISRVRPDGTLERVTAISNGPAPTGSAVGDGGPAIDAPVVFPLAVAVDPAGNVFIPDQSDRIRRIDAQSGVITTIAGDGTNEYSGDDGPAVKAHLAWPTHIAADAEDVFFIDFGASRIRRVNLASGLITTFAGTGTAGDSGDNGPATRAQFDTGDADSGHLALDPSGNLYLADTQNFRIRRIDRRSGVITTFYRLPRSNARDYVGRVRSLAFDHEGAAYVGGSGRVVKVSARGEFVTAWGAGGYSLPVEGGSAETAGLGLVVGLAVGDGANIYYSDSAVSRVRRIDVASNRLFTVAGIGPAIIGEQGPAVATIIRPLDLVADKDGNLLIADATLRIRRLDRNGMITTIAGTGSFVGQPLPAPALAAVAGGDGIEINAAGEIETTAQSTIARVDASGVLRNLVGQGGVCDYGGDGGPAAQATLCQAWDSVRDAAGNLYIADTNNNRIRRVDAQTGVITTIVGNGGPVSGYERYNNGRSCGDGGAAIDACINTPYGVAVDTSGNLFISERPGIRKVDTAGRISTFAAIANTTKLVFDRSGNLYAGVIAGIFRLDAGGRRTFVAGRSGSGTDSGFSGDGGPATDAKVSISSQAAGIAIDGEGNLYFCDNGRIRAVRLAVR